MLPEFVVVIDVQLEHGILPGSESVESNPDIQAAW